MASLDELREERLKKLSLLAERGIPAYPVSSARDTTVEEAVGSFDTLQKKEAILALAGRVRTIRAQGALIFFDLDDGSGVIQCLLKKDAVAHDLFSLFGEGVDGGDFVEVRGSLFLTKRGEKTLAVGDWRMLAKALRPLPDKFHGLADAEERQRRRYLDILANPEARERFLLRSRTVSFLRAELDRAGFLEVETPALQPLYGGASAEPFTTHHNALDQDLYLRISDELYLKRLLVAGFPKVYELCKDFRNEGVDATHYPEFTMLEWYESYSDALKQRKFVEELFRMLVRDIKKESGVSYGGETVDFLKPFRVVKYFALLEEHTGAPNLKEVTLPELREHAEKLGAEFAPEDGRGKILDILYKKFCRGKLIQPTFIIDYPADAFPLTKKKEDDPSLVDMFQLVIGGLEIVKAFSELNDPREQRERFLAQDVLAGRGDKEAQPVDEDFLEAMEHGMPPAGGVGIGIDRLVMLLTGTQNIKDTILFPTMRPAAGR